jgi:hypothetical protein
VYWYRNIAGNDDRPNVFDHASKVQFVARQGENYYIAVDSYTDGFSSGGTGTIHLNLKLEQRGIFGFSASNYSVNEGAGTATITVKRNGGSIGYATVQYSMVNGTAGSADYTNVQGTLAFADGETSKTFKIPIKNDAKHENAETITLRLGSATGGTIIGSVGQATLKIVDNDAAPAPAATAGATPLTTASGDQVDAGSSSQFAAYLLPTSESSKPRHPASVDQVFDADEWGS